MATDVVTSTPIAPTLPRHRRHGRSNERGRSGEHGKRWDIEGLRAIAVGLVVLYHANLGPFHGGFVGVDVFFVISGFLITGLLLREFERSGRVSIAGFYARRLRRIVPAATLTIVATVIASGLVLGMVRIGSISRDGLWASVFLANFRFLASGTDYFSAGTPPSPLQHFWSLAVEEQFYVVWPLLLLGLLLLGARLRRHPHLLPTVVMVGATSASLWWCIEQTRTNATSAYFSPWTRAWELGFGAILALLVPWLLRLPGFVSALLGAAGLSAVFYAALRYTEATSFPGSAAILPVVGSAAILAAGTRIRNASYSPSRLLGIPPLRWIGGVSYTIYLWHWPILIIATQRYPWLNAADRAGLVLAAVALSAVTHALIENPIRFAKPLVRSRFKAIAVGIVIVLIGAGVSNASVVMANGRVEAASTRAAIREKIAQSTIAVPFVTEAAVLKAVAAAPQLKKVPSDLAPPLLDPSGSFNAQCQQGPKTIGSGNGQLCYLGDPNSKQLVVLYGDSRAGMWSFPLAAIALQAHVRLAMVWKGNCPPLPLSYYSDELKATDTACDQFHDLAPSLINNLHPALVIATAAAYPRQDPSKKTYSSQQWIDGWHALVESIQAPGRKFVMLGDIPRDVTGANPVDCVGSHADDVQACSVPVDRAKSPNRAAEQEAAKELGMLYIDPFPWACTSVCSPIVGNLLVYKDSVHFTNLFVSYLAGSLGSALQKSLSQATQTGGG